MQIARSLQSEFGVVGEHGRDFERHPTIGLVGSDKDGLEQICRTDEICECQLKEKILGRCRNGSCLGNVIVITYTASGVKQEIAKEGILPWPKFFGQNYDLSLGRILRWVRNKKSINKRFSFWFRTKRLAPENFVGRSYGQAAGFRTQN